MATITKRKNGNYLLSSAGVEDVVKFDQDIGEFIANNANKVRYHSRSGLWHYKNQKGRETTLARMIYVNKKRCRSLDDVAGKVAFKNGDNLDMRRENLTTM